MQTLNLPPFKISLSGTKDHPLIFDFLRQKNVALTPEEWVRQHFTHFLIEHKGYPRELLANEVSIQIGNKKLRADSILYDNQCKPRMIIEYKAPNITITQQVFNQILVYNSLLHVDYIIVSNGLSHYCCHINYETNNIDYLTDIPDYSSL